jgi:metallo-beta-lactamase family protein
MWAWVTIDAVVVTHAHIDHSGWLPGLVRDGYDGPIHATRRTVDLCRILLPDAAHLQEEQARFANERGFSKHRPALPLYTSDDAVATLPLFRGTHFDTPVEVAPGVVARFVPAGHILGSASVHLSIEDDEGETTLLVSGDLGRGGHPLVPGPTTPPPADTALIESTYGGSIHPSWHDELDDLARLVSATARRGGIVLVPAFAVDRTEVLLLALRDLMADGRIPELPVFVDSPMALRVLDVYRDANPGIEFDPGGGLHECPTVEQSKALNELASPAIIISASGMATGGRVLHHLARLLPDHRNAVVLCGFQAAGTRGRTLADGARSVKMLGRYVPVRATVMVVRSLSVHADGLAAWIDALPRRPSTVFVVHGEERTSETFAERLADEGQNAVVPHQFETVRLP